jgi:DNA-binding response OmpR family regulator
VAPSVLVADDEPRLLRLMERLLARAGYDVMTARDGDEAARVYRAHRSAIGVAVLDAAIAPRGSGAVLDSLPEGREGPGVVLTSGGVLDECIGAKLLRHRGVFLHKPFAPAALLKAVEATLLEGVG